jgi:electron transport complex protein RnfB
MVPVEVDAAHWEWNFKKVPVGDIPIKQVS